MCPSAASFQALLSREQCGCTRSTAWQGDARAARHGSVPNAYRRLAGSSRWRKQPLREPKPAQPRAQRCWQQGWLSDSRRPLHAAQGKTSAAHFVITPGKQRKGSMESAHKITESSPGCQKHHFCRALPSKGSSPLHPAFGAKGTAGLHVGAQPLIRAAGALGQLPVPV